MSGSQHNPNGRQSQLGSGWSPLQVMANLLARAPQAHMASDRGVTWHTPTPPPHLYHVPAPSPPDPLQAMKNAGGNSVFRHTATPPELYRHTPTPPDKHLMRHTPSPGDVKAAGGMPPEIYQHLGPGRDQLMVAAARVGVDLTLGSRANGAAPLPLPLAPPPASPALSVRDAPTINSLLGRAGGRRVDSLLGRLAAAPQSPQSPPSVIVPGPRAPPSPSPPSSNEDSADSCGAVVGSKRKRKPERTVRVPAPPAPAHARENGDAALAELRGPAPAPPPPTAPSPAPPAAPPSPPAAPPSPESPPSPPLPTSPVRNEGGSPRRKTRSGSAETIADIAAMIAGGVSGAGACLEGSSAPAPVPLSVDKLQSVLASPEPEPRAEPPPAPAQPPPAPAQPPPAPAQPAAARRAPAATPPRAEPAPAHTTHTTHDPDKDDVTSTECGRSGAGAAAPRAAGGRGPVDSPSEGRAAEPAGSPAPPPAPPAPPPDPPAPSFVEVENQLEKMFAGIEEEPQASSVPEASGARRSGAGGKRRRVSSVGAGRGREAARRGREREAGRRRTPRSKPAPAPAPAPAPGRARDVAALAHAKEGYDSGSNASSSRSRGPYIQIVGPRDSPVSVTVMNAGSCGGGAGAGGGLAGGEEEGEARGRGRGGRRRGLHASTLGLRYDAATRDVTWVCALCLRPPHSDQLGDLFGPYPLDTDCDEYRALDESSRRRHEAGGGGARPEAWLHAECGVWAPGVVASGARLWGLARAVWAAAGSRCAHCPRAGAALACSRRACPSRAHLPCARAHRWRLSEDDFRPLCPAHAQHPP